MPSKTKIEVEFQGERTWGGKHYAAYVDGELIYYGESLAEAKARVEVEDLGFTRNEARVVRLADLNFLN